MSTHKIICGDCKNILSTLPNATAIICDPPDNLGVNYNSFLDKWETPGDYIKWLMIRLKIAEEKSDKLWLSFYHKHIVNVVTMTSAFLNMEQRLFLWRFTFGQHRQTDCGNGFRPILRFGDPKLFYPDAIRVASARQRMGDKRADPRGRVPDDVWEFPRVCGTFKEKRKWHKNQHPEALIERILLFSCRPNTDDVVYDLFGGTFTVDRVCRRLGINSVSIEISQYYCDKRLEEIRNSL